MGLRDLIRAAVRPKLSSKFSALIVQPLLVESDDSEDAAVNDIAEIQSLSGLSLVIEYRDSSAKLSQRIITCQQYSVRAEKAYLQAYCHHRKALRSFRIDRILDIFDATTGECLSPVEAFFETYTPDKVAKSGLTWGLSVHRRADLIALLNALVFIARCDREFHPNEIDCLEQAISNFWLRMEIDSDPDLDDILSYSERLAPDGETFWLAMHRFREEPVLSGIFRRNAHRLIQADGVVRPEENYWAIEIDDFLNDN